MLYLLLLKQVFLKQLFLLLHKKLQLEFKQDLKIKVKQLQQAQFILWQFQREQD